MSKLAEQAWKRIRDFLDIIRQKSEMECDPTDIPVSL